VHTIGCESDAMAIYAEHLARGQRSDYFIGAGANRFAYRVGNVVYKVDYDYPETSNLAEYSWWEQVLSHINVPENVRVAFVPVELYEVRIDGRTHYVNAMPFIDGEALGDEDGGIELPDREMCFLEELGLTDMFYENVRYADGTFYIVDAEM